MSIPQRRGEHYYFLHDKGDQNQPIMYKIKEKMSQKAIKESPLSTAEVFMDPNTFKDEAVLGKKDSWSESGKYYIYSVTKKGSDW